jgi:FkbM family methyltransferase
VKKLASQYANLFECEIIPRWRLRRLWIAKKTRRIFDLLNIECVIDVGANLGQYRDFIRLEVGFEGPIHSFEPVASLVGQLKQRQASDPSWFVHPFALGAQNVKKEINVMAATVFSSFLRPNNESVPEYTALNTVKSTERVTIRRLDDVLTQELSGVDLGRTYLKLDTQGFDLEVLKGGAFAVSKIPALQTELSFQPFYAGMPNFRDALDAFGCAGFVVSDLFLVAEDKQLMAAEFDCLMIRKQS